MSRWMKVAALGLAAVVGLVPAFAQLSYAQALPEPVAVLPIGEDVPDEELLEVEGQLVEFWYWETVLILARLLAVGTIPRGSHIRPLGTFCTRPKQGWPR